MRQSKALGIVLIAHGSRRKEANDDLHEIAENFRKNGYSNTVASFLELADPTIVAAGDQCVKNGASKVALVPYFLAAGMHVVEDLEAARIELAAMHPAVDFRCALPLGPHPLLERILIERVDECFGSSI